MAREYPGYRETIERLERDYPGRELLGLEDLKRITGRGRSWIFEHFPLIGGQTTKEVVARTLCARYRCHD